MPRVSRVYLTILFYADFGSWELQLKKLKATRKSPAENERRGAVGQRTLGNAEKRMFIKEGQKGKTVSCSEEYPICR